MFKLTLEELVKTSVSQNDKLFIRITELPSVLSVVQ